MADPTTVTVPEETPQETAAPTATGAPDPRAEHPAMAPMPTPREQGRKVVLSVDDDKSVRLAGREIFTGSHEELLERIDGMRQHRRPSLIVTSNVDQLIDLEESNASLAAYRAADLVVLDGMPLVFLARSLGADEVHRHTGADLLPLLTEVSAEREWRICIIGGGPGVAEVAAERLQERYPGSSVTTVPFPMVSWVGAPEARMVITELTAAKPDIVFVCLGAPKQEQWFVQWRGELPPAVYIGAGAAVDFAAGVHQRAPRLAQQLGAEWLWRVAQEPQRLAARYLVKGPRFLLIVLRSWLGSQLHLGEPTPSRVSRVAPYAPAVPGQPPPTGPGGTMPALGRRLSDRMVRDPETVADVTWRTRYVRSARWLDVASLAVAVTSAALLRFGAGVGESEPDWTLRYGAISAGIALVWLTILATLGAYDPRIVGEGSVEYRKALQAGGVVLALVGVASLVTTFSPSRAYLLMALGLAALLTLGNRWFLRMRLRRRRAKGEAIDRVLVLGGKYATQSLAQSFASHRDHGYQVRGMWLPLRGDDPPPTVGIDGESLPVWGWNHTLDQALRGTKASTVIVTDTELLGDRGLKALGWALEGSGIDLLLSPNVVDVAGPRIHVRPVARLPLLHLDEPQYVGATRATKTIFDRTIAALALLLLSPVLLTVALLVVTTSRGPALYRSQRVGTNGAPFHMLKFRTMVRNADTMAAELSHLDVADGPTFKIPDDPRVTRVGRWLRRYSIDELPQLLNVLRGDMSLVGPRPPLPDEVSEWNPGVERRLLVPQGMTGLWQVSGRSDLPWSQAVRLDLDYVENWSMARDLQIIWATVRAVIRSEGAY